MAKIDPVIIRRKTHADSIVHYKSCGVCSRLELLMGIGARLKQVRNLKGYTQNSLADAIGVSRGVITNIEHEKAEPQLLVIREICYVLGINMSWLLNGDPPMEDEEKQEKSIRLLAEIYHSASLLSEAEQDYILDLIKTFQKHKDTLMRKTEKDTPGNGD